MLDLGFRVQGLGIMDKGLGEVRGFRVQGLGFRMSRLLQHGLNALLEGFRV